MERGWKIPLPRTAHRLARDEPQEETDVSAASCDVVFSTTHECRARACQKHCSALFVQLEGASPDEQFRFCYRCHKFHPLDNFRGPDSKLLRGTTARSPGAEAGAPKRKDALKASKKMAEARPEPPRADRGGESHRRQQRGPAPLANRLVIT